VASVLLCSLMKHTNISQSQSFLDLLNLFDWTTTTQQLSISNWTPFRVDFERRTTPSKFAYLLVKSGS